MRKTFMRTYRLTVNLEALSLRCRLIRTLWSLVYQIFFRPSPRFFHAYRSVILRLFGAKIGVGVHVYPSAKIWYPYNLRLDDNSSIDEDVDVYNVDTIHLMKGAKVSKRAFLCTASHLYIEATRPLITAPIIIGENSWVSAEAFVGPGVVIGNNVNIMARVCISQDVPDKTVVKLNKNYDTQSLSCQ